MLGSQRNHLLRLRAGGGRDAPVLAEWVESSGLEDMVTVFVVPNIIAQARIEPMVTWVTWVTWVTLVTLVVI